MNKSVVSIVFTAVWCSGCNGNTPLSPTALPETGSAEAPTRTMAEGRSPSELSAHSVAISALASPSRVTCGYKSGSLPRLASASETLLASIASAAGLTSCTITSTARTSAEQAQEMFNYIRKYSVADDKALYGSAGDKVIDTYVAAKNVKPPLSDSAILNKMTVAVVAVLPEARSLNQLMHVDRNGFDVFDISVGTLQPQTSTAKTAFKNQAAKNSGVFRFLSDSNSNEKDAYHFEIRK